MPKINPKNEGLNIEYVLPNKGDLQIFYINGQATITEITIKKLTN